MLIGDLLEAFDEFNSSLSRGFGIGGFRNDAPWSSSAEVESRFALPSGELISRRARGDVRPEDFSGEPPPGAWE